MDISEKISELRKRGGYSQEQLAEKLGVSCRSVSKWESGGEIPDTDKIIAMSKLFGVPADCLLSDSEIPEAEPPKENSDAEITKSIPITKEYISCEQTEDKKPKKGIAKKIIAAVVCVCVTVAAVAVPLHFGGLRETWWAICGGKVQYPYVLVHGLGGWGDSSGMNSVSKYWGASTGDLSAYLEGEGYTVYEPTVGPISSTWDRACELYAELTGTTVDYGEAHSKEHNHKRFGRNYSTALFEGWGTKKNGGQIQKINLVGHSLGGATVRMLASLLEYGSDAEKNASGDDVSPLFTGGKGDWVNSVTTLCAPHNGSSLTCVIDSVGSVAGIDNATEMLAALCFAAAGVSKPVSGVYDFMLDQFGVGQVTGGYSEIVKAISAATESGNDHAGYDLSPDGAAEINKGIKTVDGVYYFSYAYLTTQKGKVLPGQVPIPSTLPILYPTALAMGSFKGTTPGGISIDESWQPNDGLVSVVSAKYPTGDKYVDFDGDVKNIKKGIWNYMGTSEGDHGTVIGLNADTQKTHDFYDNLFSMIDSLKR